MANWYVRSAAAGTGSGADWTNAKTTLAAALTAGAAGDSFYVSEDHAETQATAMTLTCPGTAAAPCRILCVNHAGSVPPVSADLRTTATVTTTGNSNLTLNGSFYCYGVTFACGTGNNDARFVTGSTAVSSVQVFDSCGLKIPPTSGGRLTLNAGSPNNKTELVNTPLFFGNTGQFVDARGGIVWRDSAALAAGSAVPTSVFSVAGTQAEWFRVRAVDLSGVTSGNALFTASNSSLSLVEVIDCKLAAGVVKTTGAVASPGSFGARFVNCDAGDTNYRYYLQQYAGEVFDETTVTKTGSLSTDGTTPLTWKVVTNANPEWFAPLETDWVAVWLDAAASKNIAFSVLTDGVTLTSADAWAEVRYQGDPAHATPLGASASDRTADVLAAGANQTTDTATWTTTGIVSPVKQKLDVTVTTTGKGIVWARVCVAKPSVTVYVDAAPVVA